MKKILSLLFFLPVLSDCYSQANHSLTKRTHELSNMGDTYVVIVHLNQISFKKKCSCASFEIGQCYLFSGNIKHIYYLADKTVFDSVSLKDVKYFIVNSTKEVKPNNDYLVTLRPGSTNRYLVLNNILSLNDPETYAFVNKGPYISGFTNCVKIGLFNKFLLSIGFAKAEKVYRNKELKRDDFDEFIRTQYSH